MAKKNKKQLSVKEQKSRYKKLQYATFISEFVALMIPYGVMALVNREEWFTHEEGWKIGLGGGLALALMGLAVFLVSKNKENKKVTSGYISLIVGWFAVAFIFVLLQQIMEQIATIMLFGGFGLMTAFGLDLTSKSFKKKAEDLQNAMDKADEELIKDEYKKEKEKEVPIE